MSPVHLPPGRVDCGVNAGILLVAYSRGRPPEKVPAMPVTQTQVDLIDR